LSLKNLQEKWKSFGFKTLRADGHNEEALYKALTAEHEGQPLAVIADTIKGKGVSFMENNPLWHNGRLTDEQLKTALSEVANGKR
ncbi:MAG: transketolase, partial [Candidatus Cloacimonetes bacterium]|nr:transketolase [Candidatus Cloacimonadota bacterium]